MTKNINYVSHKKSKVKLNNGNPQLPSASALVEGEIAINYAKDVETLSIKNESGTVVTFSSDDYYTKKKLGDWFSGDTTVTEVISKSEETIAAALNDINDKKLDIADFDGELSNYYTKDETSGATEISNALGAKVNSATYTGHTADTTLHFSGEEKNNLDALATNIQTISGITAQDIENWNHGGGVDLSDYYKKSETSSKTEIDTALEEKANNASLIELSGNVITLSGDVITLNNTVSGHTADTTIHVTSSDKTNWDNKLDADALDNYYTKAEIDATDHAISIAFNDINAKKLDASAYTPTDLSDYYTKSETSGSSEIASALTEKTDVSAFTSHTSNTEIHFSTNEKEKFDSLLDNIVTISGISSTDVDNWNDAVLSSHTHTNKTYLDGITGTVGTMAYENANSYSSATEVNGAISAFADSVTYNTTTHYVEFYHGTTAGTKVFEFDASPFIIDGMVNNVEIKDITSGESQVTCIVVSFNTDSGKQDINIPISQIFDANNYYTTAQTSGASEIASALSGKTDTATTAALDSVVTGHTANTTIHLTSTEKEQLHTHTNKTYLDGITGTVKSMAYQDASSYSSATEVNSALNGKVDKTEYAVFSAATNASIEDLSAQSETVAAALNDLNDKKLDSSDFDELLNGKVDSEDYEADSMAISIALNDLNEKKTDISAFTSHTGSSVHMTSTEKTNLDSLETNINTISGITAAKVTNWDSAFTDSHTHSNKSTLDAITASSAAINSLTGVVGTMAFQNANSYSSATEVNTALGLKADQTLIDDLSGQSETVAAALNDLNDKKADMDEVEALLDGKVDNDAYEDDSMAISIALNDLYKKIQELETAITEIRNNQ